MRNVLLISCIVLFALVTGAASSHFSAEAKTATHEPAPTTSIRSKSDSIYDSLHLQQKGLSKQTFEIAWHGYEQLLQSGQLVQSGILSIADMSLPSSSKRLFVIDVSQLKLLFHTYVAHGRNSGLLHAQSFSNAPQSFKTSIGFYVTANTYNGKHGYSLQLKGMEKGFNDNALSRAIVMHAADYVEEKIVQSQGYLGRSLGCPAVPTALHKPIINTIANGTCLFIYGNQPNYLSTSKLVKQSSSDKS